MVWHLLNMPGPGFDPQHYEKKKKKDIEFLLLLLFFFGGGISARQASTI
jgi:hypothetical protein